ncbi:TetR family transcriptional regulator [Mycobacterium spongiae]|uniref:TetR family transcriptional regulator n=2 Tax=Mycobacterium spongiae TaxID=886343 RepID=A0A975K1Q6_9MYCO|nr:TetR family transcriptional regulator [Mycobacterium spongiae]
MERGNEVRQRLTSAAVELIPERGWTAVSTRILAERAGVTPSVVHYHYSSLQALLREAVIGAMRQRVNDINTLVEIAATATDLIDVLLKSSDRHSGDDPTARLFVEAYLAASRDAQLRHEMACELADLREAFARRLLECGVPAHGDTAAILLAALDGALLHRGLGIGPDAKPAAAILHRLVAPDDTLSTAGHEGTRREMS